MLNFPTKWRVTPPPDGELFTATIPQEACEEFLGLAQSIAINATERKRAFEEFKRGFAQAKGVGSYPSSSADYAEYDLRESMKESCANAPKFLEAFHSGWCAVAEFSPETVAFDADTMNALCEKHDLGFIVEPPDLKLRDNVRIVSVTQTSLLDNAHQELREADERARELLQDGRGREAVQSSLYLLESVSTAFNQVGVKGKYFNKIVSELKVLSSGKMLARVLEWVEQLHGYLSAPKGGGVRHGLDISRDPIELHEAKLCCNLIHSYVNYLISEYERELKRQGK